MDADKEPLDTDTTELDTAVRIVSKVPEVDDEFVMTGEPAQSLLFMNDALVLPDSVKRYTKAVSAIHSIPNAPMSVTARRMMDACILIAQLYFRRLKPAEIEQMRAVRASPMFEVRTNYLRKLGGIRERNLSAVQDSLELLRKTGFRWNTVGEDQSVTFNMFSSFVTSWGTGQGKSTGWVRFALEPAVLELILDPRMFAAFSLQVMDDLRTESSYMLFQTVFRYVNSNAKVTPYLPVTMWIELMRGPCSYVVEDPKTGAKDHRNLHDFKRRELMPAIARINAIDALNYSIELIERKSGPKIVSWRFKFIPKTQQAFRFTIPMNWPIEMKPLLLSMGFTEAELVDMAQGHNTAEIAEGLRRLEEAEKAKLKQGSRIYSRKHYFLTVLESMVDQKKLEEKEMDELETVARKKAEEEAAERRQESLQERFAEHQITVLGKSLEGMPEEARKGLLDAFNDYAAKSLNTVEQRLISKDPGIKGRPVFLLLRKWLQEHRAKEMLELFPYPQDREFQAWVMWQVEKKSASDSP